MSASGVAGGSGCDADAVVHINLFIKPSDGGLFGVHMESSLNTIAMLRRHATVVAKFEDRASSVKLLYGGMTLEDHHTLEDVGVSGSGSTIFAVGRAVKAGRIEPTASGYKSSSGNTGGGRVDVGTSTPVEIFIKLNEGRLIHLEMDSLMDTMGKVRQHHKLVAILRNWASSLRFTFDGRFLKDDETLGGVGVALSGSWIFAVP